MGKIKIAVFDAGPFIHLSEISFIKILALFENILVTKEVLEEVGSIIRDNINGNKRVHIKTLNPESKNISKYILEQYNIDLGEASSIALCRQENIKLFFTDDLDAKETAKSMGIEVHGTLAIITRCLAEKIIAKKEAIEIINRLYEKSTLYLTKDLKDWVQNEINKF